MENKRGAEETSALSSEEVAQARKVVAVVSRNQLLPNYLACTGLPEESLTNATRNEVNSALNKMAEEGEVDKISAPMLMAFVKVGAELCDDLIAMENNTTERRFFNGFNLGNAGNGNNSGTPDMSSSINKLASACWGRAPTSAEISMIMDSISQTALGDATNRNAALYVCTSVLASSSAVKF